VLRSLRTKDLLVVTLLAAAMLQFHADNDAVAKARAGGSNAGVAQGAPQGPAQAEADATPSPLVTEVARPSYAPGSTEWAVFDALNDARAKGNFGLLAQDTRLDAAAAGHGDYMAQNLGGAISHRQDSARPGFSGATPIDRVRAIGYDTAVAFEAISSGTSAKGCLELLNTVYHLGLLMIGATDVGIAVNPSAGCVIEPQVPGHAQRMQARPAGTVGVYPFPGQHGVPAGFMPATEMPNPAPDLGDAVVGPPILVDLTSAAPGGLAPSDIAIGRFALIEAASGKPVEARVLASRSVAARAGAEVELRVDRRLASAGHVFLLPLRPLKSTASYEVEFSASVDGMAVSRRWDFTTR